MRHYEMAGYGFVATLAEHLGFLEDAAAMFTSLAEANESQSRLMQVSARVFDAGTTAIPASA
jgi:ferritin-like metal-binding protein YciE